MATLAAGSRIQMRYIKEASFGTTPTSGDVHLIRYTGDTFAYDISKESSNEINPHRGVTSVVVLDAETNGDLNFEFQYAEYDELIAATLQDTWKEYGVNDGESDDLTLTFDKTAGTITASAPATGDEFTNLQVGQWFTVDVASDKLNYRKLFRVASVTSGAITVNVNTPVETEGPITGRIRTSRLSNGTTQPSYTFERAYTDVGEFFRFTGMTAGSMNLSVAAGATSTGSFTFQGKKADADSQTFFDYSGALGTNHDEIASHTYQGMSSVSGTSCAVWIDGAPLSGTFVNSLELTYDNQLRAQNAICTLGAVAIASGQIDCKISAEIYFASGRVFYDKFLNNEDAEVCFTAFDAEGNGYVFTLPKGNMSGYDLSGDGNDSDVMVTAEFTGMLSTSGTPALNNKVLFIDRVGKAVA